MIGKKFGRLTVMGNAGLDKQQRRKLDCVCDCGKEIIVSAYNVKSGHTNSCGCLRREATSIALGTHRMSGSKEYNIWEAMRRRCNSTASKAFKDYGGRGISVCPEWNRFEQFYADMGSRPSPSDQIDRIDNNGNYEPGNCRWVSCTVNARNKRSNRLITFDGMTKCVTEWAEHIGMNKGALETRLRLGWTIERALTQQVRQRGNL